MNGVHQIFAPMTGKVMPLKEVDDGVFSEGMLGNGAAIDPEDGIVVAPFDGTVSMVFDTKHAIGLASNDGIELLIHIGIDTVQLNGKCFDVKVKAGDAIKKGDVLANVDLKGIVEAGYRTVTPIIVSNTDDYENISIAAEGKVRKQDKLLIVK
jgi:PTS system D-glucosamine-specific IIC component